MKKYLFNPKTVAKFSSNMKLNQKQKASAKAWLDLLEQGQLKKEKLNYFKFSEYILKDLLGYDIKKDMDHEAGNIEFSFKNKTGKTVLGIEAKGTKTADLFAEQRGYREGQNTPLNQLWTYMGKLNLDYGIATNYKHFILIDRSRGSTRNHFFDFEEIKDDETKLKEFVAIFSKEQIIDNNFVEKLKEESDIEERNFTKEFYKLFHETRLMLLKEFQENGVSKEEAIHYAQLYLNRLMFVFFAEDTDKLEKRIFEEMVISALKSEMLISDQSKIVSDTILSLFMRLDKGSTTPKKIFGFNGGLFHEEIPPSIFFKDLRKKEFFKEIYRYYKLKKELELDGISREIFQKYENKINPIIRNLFTMASFDFNTEINVNILGHIFEQSLSDIEELKEGKATKRKKEGIFYTPEYITDYICRNTIIPYLAKKKATTPRELILEHSKDIAELEKKFKEIKILDPACGSGAFLIKAIDLLLEIHKEIQLFKEDEGQYLAIKKGRKKKKDVTQFTLTKWHEEDEAREIIENNIYGVDINEESIEITKLSLFLKIARKNKKLMNLSKNIKCGNSLIDDKEVAGELAFDWEKEFPFKFDIVIGNPPYVNIANISNPKVRRYYQSNYKTVKNKSDLYSIFIEKATGLLKRNGLLSFIFSNSWLGTDSFSKFRKFLIEDTCVLKLVELPAGVFEDAIVTAVIIVLSNSKSEQNHKIELFKFWENKFDKVKHSLSYERIKSNENLTFSFEPIVNFNTETIKLDEIAKFSLGIKTSNDKRFILDEKKDQECYPVLRGKDIYKYYSGIPKKWVWYKPKLMMEKTGAGPRHLEYFLKPKIFIQDVAKSIIACYDVDNNLSTDTLSLIYEIDQEVNLKYVLTLLNSNFVNKWFKNNFPEGLHIKINQLKQIPIPKISSSEQKPFIEKADLMLNLNKDFYDKKNKFFNRLNKSFGLEKLNRKLDDFYELEFNDFIKEIEKLSKNKLSLKEQDEWEDYFNEYKKDLLNLKNQIEKTDNEINNMVYKLYGLTKEDIKVIEESLK